MKRGIILNGVVISAGERLEGAAVVICGDKVERVVPAGGPLPAADWLYNANGRYVFPGFVDVHAHGAAGYDITDDDPKAVVAVAEAKLAEGVTRFCPTTLTLPEAQLAAALGRVAEYRADERFSKGLGVHLEGPFINPGALGAQNPDYVRKPDIEEVKRLHAISPVSHVTYAAELDGGADFAAALLQCGIVPTCGHSKCGYAAFKEVYASGLRHLTHFCNQMTPLHHRDIGLVGAGLLHDDIRIELICDKIHVSPEMLAIIFATKPAEAVLLITDSMRASHLPDGMSSLGGLEVIVKNGEARLVKDGALAGSTLRMNIALTNAAEVSGKPLEEVVAMAGHNQARELGLGERLGRLAPGYAADVVIVNPATFAVDAVFVDGEQRL